MVKKGQVKIQQTAFMIIAITIFLILVGLFALSFSLSGVKNKATELEEQRATSLILNLANSPEFSCEEAFGGTKTYCIDFDKAMTLKKNIEIYKDIWDVENIEIRKIFPVLETERLCTQNNYPDCNLLRIISDEPTGFPSLPSFVSICRKESKEGNIYNKCELAQINIFYKKVQ